MKIILSTDPKHDDNEGYLISSSEKIFELTDNDFEQLKEVKVYNTNLGLEFIFWMADHWLKYINSFKFTIMVDNYTDSEDLRSFMLKYRHKLERQKNRTVFHGKKIQDFSTL